jgi:uncharacterized membrane protein YcaP (DUF421 family)
MMYAARVNQILEILRWLSVPAGIFLAYYLGKNPIQQFSILSLIVIVFIAGLTGIESLFFGKAASEDSGYMSHGAYQRQSGMNNLALAITIVLANLFGWGLYADISLMAVLLIFLTLSAINHAFSVLKEDNRSMKNMLRPFLVAILLIVIVPFMVRALAVA